MLPFPKFIGHRGVKGLAPENTLISFRKAKEVSFSWIEFDVMLTACGEAVIIHDDTLKRTTNGCGYVAKKTYAEIYQLDAGSWFGAEFAYERIPTLVETIYCLAELNLQANIEIKPTRGRERETAQTIVEVLQRHWPKTLAKPLISSFSLASLHTVHALDKSLPIAILYPKLPRYWQQAATELNAVSINLSQRHVTEAQVKAIKTTQRAVMVYTVNDEAFARTLFTWGVDSLFADLPLLSLE